MADREFEELLATIDKLNAELGNLAARAVDIQKQFTSGNWGTQQLKEFREELTKVTQQFANKQVRMENLINQRNLIESTKEFNALSKAIDTVEKNLAGLRRDKEQVGSTLAGRMSDDFRLIEEAIKKQERALNSFYSRAFRNFTPQGTRRDPNAVDPLASGAGNVDLASRLGPARTTTAEAGRRIYENTVNELQNEILRRAIADRQSGAAKAKVLQEFDANRERLKRDLEADVSRFVQDRERATQEANRPASQGLINAVNRVSPLPRTQAEINQQINDQQNKLLADAIRQRQNQLTSQVSRVQALAGGFPARPDTPFASSNPSVTDIPKPTPNISTNEDFLRRRAENLAREVAKKVMEAVERDVRQTAIRENLAKGSNYDRFKQRIQEQDRLDAFRQGRLPTYDKEQELKKARGDDDTISDRASRSELVQQTQEKLLNSLRGRVATEQKYTQALEQATRQGFTIADLKRVESRGTAGRERLQFERRDESGVNRRFDTYVDPNGRSSPGISNQFRSFGQGVVRDIGELTKWSIALAAVYGPLRKLQELTQIMIENQTRLAEAATSVASAFIDQDDIFNAAAEAANRAGESVEGVIDAFTLAYRAAGGGANEVERLATATELLDNALVLSKLSSLDQATAIDTLAAAMRQTTGELSGSIELLDSWVRVTKVANIDLASLATGFAVLGDSADAAGLSTDQLNGVLATIGETGVASGRELANTARAIVSGFQSDQAREALEKIGVAVEDSTGKMRPFLDIMTEVSNLRLSGALDDTAFSELTLDLGGGTRRQSAYATFIENIGRVNEIAAESARANGDAQAALAKQLETVQTSLTRLGNAFQELAQSLGTEGGFLGIITAMVDGMTGAVNIFDDLVSLLGKATPAMLAFVAATAALKYRGQGGIQQALGGIGAGLQRDPVAMRYYSNPALAPANGTARQFLQNNVLGNNAISGGFQGLIASALPAILNATNKDDRFGGEKAIANLIGGIGGGVLGALTGPQGAVAGAVLGTAISEAFVNSTIARRTDIFGYGAPSLSEPREVIEGTPIEDLDKNLIDAEANLYKALGFGNEGLGKILSTPGDRATGIVEQLNEAIEARDEEEFKRLLSINGDYGQFSTTNARELEAFGVSQQLLDQAYDQNRQIEFSPESRARQLATERGGEAAEALAEFDRALAARVARGGTPLDQETPFSKEVDANLKTFGSLLKELEGQAKTQLRSDRLQGDVRGAEYGRRTSALEGFDTKALQYYTALGDQVDRLTGGAEDASSAFEILRNVIVFGAEDAVPQLTALEGEIQTLRNLLADPLANTEDIANLGGLEQATELLQQKQEDFADLLADANSAALLAQVKVPGIVGDINKPLTTGEENLVQQRTAQLENQFYKDFLQLPDDMFNAIKDSFEPFAVPIKDFDDSVTSFKEVVRTDAELRQAAIAQLLEEGKLESQQVSPFGIQQLDMTSQQGAGLQGTIDYFSQYLSQNFPQYQQNPEDVGVIFSDYVTDVLHGDNLAIKLALEKIVDLNQKQLDGMYNIPEGATFWVPLTAAYYRPQTQGGTGGMPAVDAQAVDGNTTATQMNTDALRNLSDKWSNMDPLLWDREEARNQASGAQKDTFGRGATPDDYAQRHPDLSAPAVPSSDDYFNRHPETTANRGTTGGGQLDNTDSFLQRLQAWFSNLFNTTSQYRPPGLGGGSVGGGVGGGGDTTRSFGQTAAVQQVNPQVSARLEIQMDNTTTLMVDGRVLASVLSPYLAQEMVRLEAAQGTVTRRFVI